MISVVDLTSPNNAKSPQNKKEKTKINRKRKKSPIADDNHNNQNETNKENINTPNGPPRKKQRTSASRYLAKKSTISSLSSSSKKKTLKLTSSTPKPKKPHFLDSYQSEKLKIIRIKDLNRFPDDDDDDIDKERKLTFNVLSNDVDDNEINNNNSFGLISSSNWVQVSDILKSFGLKAKDLQQAKKSFFKFTEIFIREKCISQFEINSFYTKLGGRHFISEKGFCVLLLFIFNSNYFDNYLNIKHWINYRYYYRRLLYKSDIKNLKNYKKICNKNDIEICTECCLEDIEVNFVDLDIDLCDCGSTIHINCNKLGKINIPDSNNDNDNNNSEWFCPFCIREASLNVLKERRKKLNNSDSNFEVEKVIFYSKKENEYFVKWKHYPNEANSKLKLSESFLESAEIYWKNEKKLGNKISIKARNEMKELQKKSNKNKNKNKNKNENNDLSMNMKELNIDNNNNNNNKEDNDDNDVEMDEIIVKEKEKEEEEKAKFIPVKLHDIMDVNYIIRRQKYTSFTFKLYKNKHKKYRDNLVREFQENTYIGQQIKYEMREKGLTSLPKYHLTSINRDWDCSIPRIRDEIQSFLSINWNKFNNDVSSDLFVIGDIIDPHNPALKYGSDNGVHRAKAYGLFAVKFIRKETLLFEYAGCVKPIGVASSKLNHLENEFQQTTLFDLIGHLHKNRSKNIWGTKANDQLVIDPSEWHNEGVYMNDYRDRVLDDPDDDEEVVVDNGVSVSVSDPKRKQNVKFYEVLVNGWPRIFAVATTDIKIGEELLGDYGNEFWSNFRLIFKRQKELNDIKFKINNKWKIKYNKMENKLKNKINYLQNKLNKLKKQK